MPDLLPVSVPCTVPCPPQLMPSMVEDFQLVVDALILCTAVRPATDEERQILDAVSRRQSGLRAMSGLAEWSGPVDAGLMVMPFSLPTVPDPTPEICQCSICEFARIVVRGFLGLLQPESGRG